MEFSGVLYLTQRKQFLEKISLAPKLCEMYATIGVRDGGSGGGGSCPPPIRAVCRHQFGQRVDIIRAKHNTCLINTS